MSIYSSRNVFECQVSRRICSSELFHKVVCQKLERVGAVPAWMAIAPAGSG